ncbi:MAG: hypothetical protein U0166_27460 [Acidobacteriota bacterium]
MSEHHNDPERRLVEKLRRIEALHAGAKTDGERDAAAAARQRILEALGRIEKTEPLVEMTFYMKDVWRRRLMVALLRRYGIKPYRYSRQRYTTVMAKVPRSFVDGTLWPEYQELAQSLQAFLTEVTDRVIAQAMEASAEEAEVRNDPPRLAL